MSNTSDILWHLSKRYPPTVYILLGSASPTPISTDYARQKHNDSAERIYYLSSARLRVFFKWSYAVPTILYAVVCLRKDCPRADFNQRHTK